MIDYPHHLLIYSKKAHLSGVNMLTTFQNIDQERYLPRHKFPKTWNDVNADMKNISSRNIYSNVANRRYIRLLWDMAVGIYIDLYLWLTVGELRLLDVLVTLWWLAPRL